MAPTLNGMQLPQQYPYNPRVRLILFTFGTGILWVAVQWLSWGRLPTGFALWFGFIPIALALMMGVRRISVKRYLLLDRDSMEIPTGPFQATTTRIEYSSILRIWRHYLPLAVVLRVATEKRTFDIHSSLLPDNRSYRSIEEFLTLKVQENSARHIASDLG
jgi:hypothetical protein